MSMKKSRICVYCRHAANFLHRKRGAFPYGGIIRIRFRVGAYPHPLSLPHKLPAI